MVTSTCSPSPDSWYEAIPRRCRCRTGRPAASSRRSRRSPPSRLSPGSCPEPSGPRRARCRRRSSRPRQPEPPPRARRSNLSTEGYERGRRRTRPRSRTRQSSRRSSRSRHTPCRRCWWPPSAPRTGRRCRRWAQRRQSRQPEQCSGDHGGVSRLVLSVGSRSAPSPVPPRAAVPDTQRTSQSLKMLESSSSIRSHAD